MSNRYQWLELDLKKCFEYDVDWTLLPDKYREVHFAKKVVVGLPSIA